MKFIFAADVVGRGCLAGPLMVGGVLVPEDMQAPEGVTDSKKLTAAQREAAYLRLAGVEKAVARIPASDIDRDGIGPSLERAFKHVVAELLAKDVPVSSVRIDGNPMPWVFPVTVEYIVQGDANDWRIGAASIVAKVTRDRLMVEAAREHPGYGWAKNKGYGSTDHQEAIGRLGVTPLHRATFCRRFVEDDDGGVFDIF